MRDAPAWSAAHCALGTSGGSASLGWLSGTMAWATCRTSRRVPRYQRRARLSGRAARQLRTCLPHALDRRMSTVHRGAVGQGARCVVLTGRHQRSPCHHAQDRRGGGASHGEPRSHSAVTSWPSAIASAAVTEAAKVGKIPHALVVPVNVRQAVKLKMPRGAKPTTEDILRQRIGAAR
jgi:hypothetical protein